MKDAVLFYRFKLWREFVGNNDHEGPVLIARVLCLTKPELYEYRGTFEILRLEISCSDCCYFHNMNLAYLSTWASAWLFSPTRPETHE